MRIDLSGKVALVTGGASGIGQCCTKLLSEAGASVAVVDINEAGAEACAANVQNAFPYACDISDETQVTALKQDVVGAMGGVDILINSAGLIVYHRGIEGITTDDWDRLMAVNVRGTFLICRDFMPVLKQRRNGRIVTFSSLAARVGGIEVGVHYTTSKAGLLGLTRSLAKEGGPFGITANAIAPGVILTGPVQDHVGEDNDSYIDQIPLGRLGDPKDVANAVVFLVSPLAEYISGVVLDINGGMYMG